MERKKIIFIGNVFYDYHKIITNKLNEIIGETLFFPEQRSGWLFKILNNLNPKLINLYQKIYFFFIWIRLRKEKSISHLFVIRGYKMPISFIERIKRKFPNIKTIMYQWDSIKNNSYEYIIPYFDKVYTFDYKDFETNKKLLFLQLFYTDDIKAIQEKREKTKYHFFCFNSFTLERYNETIKFIQYCKEKNLNAKIFCYIPLSTFIKYKYLKRIPLRKEFLSFRPMNRSEYLNNLSLSEIVVDISHSTQSGLSMRIIESYGAGKKVLTTNKAIEKNPLCNDNWIYFFDINNIVIKDFQMKKNEIPIDNLHIDNWLKTIFEQ